MIAIGVPNIDLSDIPFEELHAIDDRIQENVMPYMSIKNSMNARTSEGGTSTVRTVEQLAHFNTWLENNR